MTLLLAYGLIGIVFAIALSFPYHTLREARKSEIACEATFADCDAGDLLMEWCFTHPDDESIASDPYARALLVRKIATHERFLETHPFIKDNGHLNLLKSHLD